MYSQSLPLGDAMAVRGEFVPDEGDLESDQREGAEHLRRPGRAHRS